VRIAPWGVVILVLLGALGLASLLTGVVLSIEAQRTSHAARQAADRFNVLLDSLAHDTTMVRRH
jgi:hypothetical protein